MDEDPLQVAALNEEIKRLNWRISTLEAAEFECARAVTALSESEARYRHLLDEAGFPITISTTSDSTILFANPLACQLFGLAGANPTERKMLEFYSEPSRRKVLIDQLRVDRAVPDWEIMILDGEGNSRILVVAASLISFEGQEAVLATANDITARRHAEALFRTLVENSPDGFVIADLKGRLTYVSPRSLEVFGFSRPEEVLGRNLQDFIAPEDHTRMAEHFHLILAGKSRGPNEYGGIRRDGSTFLQETNGEVLRNPDGSPHAFFFIVRDRENRKRIERAYRLGEKLESLGLMAAGIAHELNNAFQVTQGHLEIAQTLSEANAPVIESLARIEGSVDRAIILAREMLNYSGRTLRQDAPLNLDALLEEGLAFLRGFLASNTTLVFIPGGEPQTVQADEGQLMKVFSALVLNAIEAMAGRSGEIVITTEMHELTDTELSLGFWPAPGRAGRFLRLEVKDGGAGIVANKLERVCDPFFTTKGAGRGLGLSAALGILRSHSACLQLLSEPTAGTIVRAYFPVSLQTPSLLPSVIPSAPVAAGILLAEDDDLIRELVVRMLPKWGFAPVWEARNGAEALELYRIHQASIGIFLTDATMPMMSGPEAFEAMRKLCPTLRGVLMTGYSEAFGQGTAAAFGFSEFLNKPFRWEDLKAKLEAIRLGQAVAPD